MGAGSGPAGSGLAGADVLTSSPNVQENQLDPVRYDPKTQTFPLDEDTGLVETIHWVDEVVALALTIRQGDHSSNSTLGNKLRSIVRAGGPSLNSQVTDAVTVALRDPLDRKDILVNDIQVATPLRGQIVVAVSYINLRKSPRLPPKNIKVVIQ